MLKPFNLIKVTNYKCLAASSTILSCCSYFNGVMATTITTIAKAKKERKMKDVEWLIWYHSFILQEGIENVVTVSKYKIISHSFSLTFHCEQFLQIPAEYLLEDFPLNLKFGNSVLLCCPLCYPYILQTFPVYLVGL